MSTPKKMRIILGSGSPRRRQLLSNHFQLKIIVPQTDERQKRGERPSAYVCRVAYEKWIKSQEMAAALKNSVPLVTADTIVEVNGEVLGKPANHREALRMMKKLAGKTHRVLTSVCVGWSKASRPQKVVTCRTLVKFRSMSQSELTRYVKSRDWLGKAGAYGIQGLAIHFVDQVNGSLTSVVGLPVNETLQALAHVISHPLPRM